MGVFCIVERAFAAEKAYDLDMFDLAAGATLDRDPPSLPKAPSRAVGCHTLYSHHPGMFMGLHGIKHRPGLELEMLAKPYQQIRSPNSEYIANVYGFADTPQACESLLDDALEELEVATLVHSKQLPRPRPGR